MGRHATSLRALEARIGMPFEQFVALRFKEGKTMADITLELGEAKSSLYYWLLRAGFEVKTTSYLERTGSRVAERRAKK